MPPAARVGDPTGHLGATRTSWSAERPHWRDAGSYCRYAAHLLVPPPAVIRRPRHSARLPDRADGGRPAARMGDMSGCGAPIVMGAQTVLIGGRP